MKITIELDDADRDALIKAILAMPAVKRASEEMVKKTTDGFASLIGGFMGGG